MQKNKSFNLNIISKERTSLMGLAIIGIMFFHMSLNLSTFPILLKIKALGNIGVDIFLFLSAIGLYYSCQKSHDIKKFYQKRVLRIIPATIICLVPWYIYLVKTGMTTSITRFLLDITSLGFWIDGNNRGWYVAFIIVLYLIYPFLHKLISFNNYKENFIKCVALCILIVIINICVSLFFPNWYDGVELALSRIPIFIVGCFIAPLIYNEKELSWYYIIIFMLISIIGLWLIYNWNGVNVFSIKRYIYLFITISLIPIAALILNLINKSIFNKLLKWFGKYTLEIYLIHTQILTVLSQQCNYNLVIINIISAILSIILAVIIHNILESLLKNKL